MRRARCFVQVFAREWYFTRSSSKIRAVRFTENWRTAMNRHVLGLFVLVISIATNTAGQVGSCGAGQGSTGSGTAQARWEGVVTRSNKDQSTLTVRKSGST